MLISEVSHANSWKGNEISGNNDMNNVIEDIRM